MIKLEFEDKYALYQWDLNMRLVLTDIPVGTEVHFSDEHNTQDECPVLVSYEENGIIYANIPNIFLQKAGIITVYIYVKEENKQYTEYYAEILVLPRKKPSDYIYKETEVKSYESLEKRIKELEENGVSDEQIAQAVEDYLKENNISADVYMRVFDGYVQYSSDNEAWNNVIALSELKGKDGVDGKNGSDGKDGYTPVKGVDYFDGINGKDGYTPIKGVDYFDGQNGKDGEDGKTPQKGVDYFTEADKTDFVNSVIEALPKYNGEVENV